MSTYKNEIAGAEFDWFAKDTSGNIGLFATSGEGVVPEIVSRNFKEHSRITDSLESPNWGSEDVWSDYSGLGLYVYDWRLPVGPYELKKTPTSNISNELKIQIESLSSLIILKVDYSECHTIESV